MTWFANSARSNRIQCSTATAKLRLRQTSIAPQRLIDEALAYGPTCATFVRGFGPDLTLPREIHDPDLWTLHGDVFYDGSCIQRVAPGFCRATWPVIQMSEDNKAAVTISGPV